MGPSSLRRVRPLVLRDNQDGFNEASKTYCCSDINVIGPIKSMIEELSKLEADGGVPGDKGYERFYLTLVLALAALAADVDGGTNLYRAHLKKMAAFLEKNLPVCFKGDLTGILKALQGGTSKIDGKWGAIYLPMCKRPGMYCPEAINEMLSAA